MQDCRLFSLMFGKSACPTIQTYRDRTRPKKTYIYTIIQETLRKKFNKPSDESESSL